jgi:ElaB/YqjD/DUF883 family membrane-anchored ribosome-binding protein
VVEYLRVFCHVGFFCFSLKDGHVQRASSKKELLMAVRNFSPVTNDKSTECEVNMPCAPDDVKGKAQEVKGKVQELASSVALKAEDVAADVSHKAQDWAGNVANKAQETASAVIDKADDGIAAVGHQMNALGGKVRDAAPHNGAIGSAATAVANELQAGGHYLEGHGLEAIGKDLTDVVRRHPVPALMIGFGIGCLIGMTLLQRRS